ncbi:hypothetical protein JMA_28540 [Jeotgalibacillus malaysiensis]|uniref:Acyltransferase n=1 Tax=Jeotgalibacillus malaysiensis TaxID=1508404 RepID=A0A0B5APY8_9BACL|nr:acyltransferase family protein [Jeotgalibacillus malaysiensis]AJD92171.1 hypothetical protein JMA_28540 [Jeotgalibacillus malaysiensis]
MNDLRAPDKKFRPEIEGVRAVAALLVAVYHIWLGKVSGGVDVFFIVSGYLITTSLLSKVTREGKINFYHNILGLAKRLFPIAFLVILVSTVLSIFILPQTVWGQTIPEVFASMFYFQNWQLANNSVDYLAQNNAASPFQHFWALSIQGQFYITWPIVITLVYLLAVKVLKTPVRKTLLVVLSIIFALSLSFSIYITEVNQPYAYFNTFARAWEFSMGGILALLIPYLKFNKISNFVIGWLGLITICLTGVLLPVSNAFPGYVALLPIFGVIFVIVSAENSTRFGVDRLLGSKPLLYFGSISYGFYLWHWPLLIFYYNYFQTDKVPFLSGLIILLITVVLSIFSVKVVEKPIRTMSIKTHRKKLVGVLAGIMLPAILTGSFWQAYVIQASSDVVEITVEEYPGGKVISDQIEAEEGLDPIPSTLTIKKELPAFYDNTDCFTTGKSTALKECSFGNTEDPDYTVALVGGSHSGHWYPALEVAAESLNLQIDVLNKDACRLTNEDFDGKLTEECIEWSDKATERLLKNPPDIIFTTANVGKGAKVPEGYLSKWKEFEGISEVFAIRDNPRMKYDTPICVEEKSAADCSVPRSDALSAVQPWENTENIPENVTFADMSDYFCDEETCHAVIGNVIVYRDKHHISTLYSETMGEGLTEHLKKAIEKIESAE